MKHFFLTFLSAVIALSSMGQGAQYQEAMSKQVALLDQQSSFNPQTMQEISNTFERIADAEKSQWLPYYYAGYCQVMAAFMQQDKSKIDVLADKAASNATKAESLSQGNDEIACLKSMIASSRIAVDPSTRGQQYGPEAGGQLQQAKQLNAENPRVYLLEGQMLFYTPEAFGGSKTKARETLEVALQKFAAFKPASDIAPRWGAEYAKQLLEQAKK
jgi:hypothetical protein